MTPCSASSTARSSTFCSSRILPGPIVAQQPALGLGIDCDGTPAVARAQGPEEMVDQQWNVLPPLPERRKLSVTTSRR